jgi:hypothetical protein
MPSHKSTTPRPASRPTPPAYKPVRNAGIAKRMRNMTLGPNGPPGQPGPVIAAPVVGAQGLDYWAKMAVCDGLLGQYSAGHIQRVFKTLHTFYSQHYKEHMRARGDYKGSPAGLATWREMCGEYESQLGLIRHVIRHCC